jgi:hypothetical protein
MFYAVAQTVHHMRLCSILLLGAPSSNPGNTIAHPCSDSLTDMQSVSEQYPAVCTVVALFIVRAVESCYVAR